MGSGYRTFTAGEVLTASNVQNYLQDQSVMVFGGSAARSSAIGTANFEEGMVSYLTDTDKVEAYNGTNWVQVGSSNQGLTLISTTSFSAVSSQAVTAFSSTYNNYRIIVNITSTSTDLELRLRLGNSGTADTTGNTQFAYWLRRNNGVDDSFQGTNDTSAFLASCETFSGTSLTNVAFDIYNPFIATETGATVAIQSVNAAGSPTFGAGGFIKGSNTSWSQFFLITSTGNMTGSVKLYGYNA